MQGTGLTDTGSPGRRAPDRHQMMTVGAVTADGSSEQ
ncbi:MAG: hypothetical protein ACI9K3_000135 [Halovenus sp.]|jgi:hypothetical protein